MQAQKLRSGSSEMAHKTSSRPTRGSPVSPDSSESKTSKVLERKPSNQFTSMLEKRTMKLSEMQQQLGQLQEELKKAKEEKSRVLEELAEAKKGKSKTIENAETLELEVEKAKESERSMLESLISQTKQLEQTMISLEEAKLEIRSLQESIRILDDSASRSSRYLEKRQEKNGSTDMIHAQEEIRVLRNELKLAMEAEAKSKKAMDDLALALKEVTAEIHQAKGQLSSTQSELESIRADAENLKNMLNIANGKFQMAVEESKRAKLELEASVASWNAQENGFINSMKVSEEEIGIAKQEIDRLIDSQRVSREDNSKLRDIIKHAVNESTVVKEALEIARRENSQLKDLLSEKEKALQSIKQDYECLKVSEAAALDSVRELQGLLAATSTMKPSNTTGSPNNGSFTPPRAIVSEVRGSKICFTPPRAMATEVKGSKICFTPPRAMMANEVKGSKSMAKFPSDCWKRGNPEVQNGHRRSVEDYGKFKGSVFDTEESREQKHPTLTSANFYEFDHIDRDQLDLMGGDHGTPMRQKKKKAMLQKFGEMMKRRSFNK